MPIACKKTGKGIAIVIMVIGLHTSLNSYSQLLSSGPKNPGTAISQSAGFSNFSFSNPTSVFTSDNTRASASCLLTLLNGKTEYLKTTNFGFSIPPTALIGGISVEIEKSATGIGQILFLESYVTDYSVRLVKAGTITGNNKATATHWTDTDTYATYGSNTDLWGTAWTAADINSGNFGVAFAGETNGLISGLVSLLPSIRINHIRITVSYVNGVLPVHLLNFDVTAGKKNTALVNWKMPPENSATSFALQRSHNGSGWETLQAAIVEPAKSNIGSYSTVDNNPYPGKSFYRLQITSISGEITYSESKSITFESLTMVKAYPNPFTSYVLVTSTEKNKLLLLYNEYGQLVPVPKRKNGPIVRLELTALRKGIYFLVTDDERIKIIKQ